MQNVCRFSFFFFFQAEDGIRDIGVTGVQTCALPISSRTPVSSICASAGRPVLADSTLDAAPTRAAAFRKSRLSALIVSVIVPSPFASSFGQRLAPLAVIGQSAST